MWYGLWISRPFKCYISVQGRPAASYDRPVFVTHFEPKSTNRSPTWTEGFKVTMNVLLRYDTITIYLLRYVVFVIYYYEKTHTLSVSTAVRLRIPLSFVSTSIYNFTKRYIDLYIYIFVWFVVAYLLLSIIIIDPSTDIWPLWYTYKRYQWICRMMSTSTLL